MPIYEYRCPTCGHEFERMQRVSDPLPPCPTCGHDEVRKKVSVTSFVLKGGGWYSDHYGLKKSAAPSEGGGDGGGAKSDAPAAPAAAPAPAASGTTGSSGPAAT